MKDTGISREDIISELKKTKSRDECYERVLSSMCTYPHEIATFAHNLFIESNMGDPGLFNGTSELEKEVIKMMGSLLHYDNVAGYLTTGGTESNIQAIRAMRNANKHIKEPNIVLPESAHFSFDKLADLSGIEIRKAALDKDLKVDIPIVESLIDPNTIGLVGIAGNTEFGQVDPIDMLSNIAMENRIFLHVDAAFGGFVLPFLENEISYDFKIEGVSSITMDPHKMGLSTIPSGGLLFRDEKHLKDLAVKTPYLTIQKQYSLTGTRSGAAVASTYAVMKHLGRNGYKKVVQKSMSLTDQLIKGARAMDIQPVIDPVMNIVALDLPDVSSVRKQLLDDFGWHVSITRNPEALRLVIMPHLTSDIIDDFINDLGFVLGKK